MQRHELFTNESRREAFEAQWTTNISHRQSSHGQPHRHHKARVLLCIAGVIPRGTRFAWPIVEQRFVSHLKARGHTVDIYGFNLDMGEEKVDGVRTEARDIGVVPFTFVEEAKVSDADAAIAARCKQGSCPQYTGGHFHDAPPTITKFAGLYNTRGLNAARQLLSENRVGEHLLRPETLRKYDVAVVWWAGFYPWFDTSEWSIADEVARLVAQPSAILIEESPQKGRWGHRGTDGFYIGAPLTLSKLLMRWSDVAFWDRTRDPKLQGSSGSFSSVIYEDYVARCFSWYGIDYLPASMPSPDVAGMRDGIFTHIRAFGPKPEQWAKIQRHDPVGHAVWKRVQACAGPCRVMWGHNSSAALRETPAGQGGRPGVKRSTSTSR